MQKWIEESGQVLIAKPITTSLPASTSAEDANKKKFTLAEDTRGRNQNLYLFTLRAIRLLARYAWRPLHSSGSSLFGR
jgi:hypothetical protein